LGVFRKPALVAKEYDEVFDKLFHAPRLTGADASERTSGESFECLEVTRACSRHNLGRQGRRGRALVPVKGQEIVAHELLVETRLAPPGLVLIGGPDSR